MIRFVRTFQSSSLLLEMFLRNSCSRFTALFLFLLLCSCGGNIQEVIYQTEETKSYCELDVFAQGLEVNENLKVIGEFSFTDTGFTLNCSAETVMKKLNEAACNAGADAYQLTWTQPPNMRSTCFQAKARLLKYRTN